MRVLFIGGTGNLSSACTERALEKGFEVFHLNRGSGLERENARVKTLKADIGNPETVRTAIAGLRFDSVVQFLAYRPEQVEADLDTFGDIVGQYVLISTASAYQKPSLTPVITETTPLENPFWEYSRLKIACENLLTAKAPARSFPFTIVRPSHTYGDRWIPSCFGSASYGLAWRMREGKEIVVPGDGQSLWTLTHASDFAVGLVGLLGNKAALSEAFHITSDDHLTWSAIYAITAEALGVRPKLVHIPSDYIARIKPERGAGLLGDKAVSVLFDNSKIRRFVPEFQPSVSFPEGIRRSLAWYDEHPELKAPDPTMNREMDEILGRWKSAMV
ncbi:MAG TPA: NAD-dependent epimerase/dehydratase family protein [Rectinemataceae bacterium]|nr:NAD-dependent epimerase/dehydratase family protein [Rectinemataceae bacterium]